MVSQKTLKSAKIFSLEMFRLYGICAHTQACTLTHIVCIYAHIPGKPRPEPIMLLILPIIPSRISLTHYSYFIPMPSPIILFKFLLRQ